MNVPHKEDLENERQQRRSATRCRRSVMRPHGSREPLSKAVAPNRPWRSLRLSAEWRFIGASRPRASYGFEFSLDGKAWTHLCSTRHGEGGQDVFAFPPIRGAFRALDLRKSGAATAFWRLSSQSLRSRRRRIGDGGRPHCGARPCADQGFPRAKASRSTSAMCDFRSGP